MLSESVLLFREYAQNNYYYVSENLHLSGFFFALLTTHTSIMPVPKSNSATEMNETITPAATAAVLTLSPRLSPIKIYL